MPLPYKIAIRIQVTKEQQAEPTATEELFYPDLTFRQMSQISAEFYDMTAKLEKYRKLT